MTSKTTRARHGEGTRERILSAALLIFEASGFAAGSTSAVARAAGISQSGLFAHFGSRERLVGAVAEAALIRIADDTRRRLRCASGLRGVVGGHLQAVARHEALYTRMVEHRSRLPQVAIVRLEEMEAVVADHMQRALTSGGIGCSARVGPRFAFQIWMALVHHRLLAAGRPASGVFALARRREALVRNYLALIR